MGSDLHSCPSTMCPAHNSSGLLRSKSTPKDLNLYFTSFMSVSARFEHHGCWGCQLSSHEARLDSHTKLERFSTVCRVTAAPVLRTQTYHTSQPDQRPSTCEFCSGHKHTCVAVDGGGADHRGNEAKDGLPVAALPLAKDANGSNRHLTQQCSFAW